MNLSTLILFPKISTMQQLLVVRTTTLEGAAHCLRASEFQCVELLTIQNTHFSRLKT